MEEGPQPGLQTESGLEQAQILPRYLCPGGRLAAGAQAAAALLLQFTRGLCSSKGDPGAGTRRVRRAPPAEGPTALKAPSVPGVRGLDNEAGCGSPVSGSHDGGHQRREGRRPVSVRGPV